MRVKGNILYLLAGTLLSACTQLPIDGPHHRDITEGATTSLVSNRREIVFDYALVDINKNVLQYAVDVGPGSFFRTFGARSGPAPIIRVGVGDVVQVSIF
jgi:polysaccharide export outer membrane protein